MTLITMTQHLNVTQLNDNQHNDTQYNITKYRVIMLSVIMLSVIMLSVIMLSVIILSVIMLSVVAPLCFDPKTCNIIKLAKVIKPFYSNFDFESKAKVFVNSITPILVSCFRVSLESTQIRYHLVILSNVCLTSKYKSIV